ncbi:hypothetical protein D8S78_01005 [Natrialba swarupiae]|nr:hypothetical protein [Natrialba swarupiae]
MTRLPRAGFVGFRRPALDEFRGELPSSARLERSLGKTSHIYNCFQHAGQCEIGMTSAEQSLTFFMLICAVPIAGVAAYAFRKRDEPGARGLFLCELGMAGWSIQLALITWPTAVMPVFSTRRSGTSSRSSSSSAGRFVLEYTRRGQVTVKRPWLVALLVVLVVTVVLTATNPWHHLVLAPETPGTLRNRRVRPRTVVHRPHRVRGGDGDASRRSPHRTSGRQSGITADSSCCSSPAGPSAFPARSTRMCSETSTPFRPTSI